MNSLLGSRFLWQVWGVLGATLIISTLLFGFFVMDEVERDAFDRLEQSLLEQALALTPTMTTILEQKKVFKRGEINLLTPGIVDRITLVDANGTVIVDNERDPVRMDNHLTRPEIVSSRTTSHGVAIRHSDTLNLSMFYLAIQIQDKNGERGYLRLAVPLTSIDRQLERLQRRIVFSAATVGIVFLLIGYFLASRVTDPIEKMTRIARDIARGQFQLRLPADRRDEIGQLSVVINELAYGAQQRIDELTRSRNQLAAVLSGLTEGVIAFDVRQRVLHVNNAALLMLGLKENQLAGKVFSETPTTREIKQAVQSCITNRSTVVATVNVADQTLECSCVWLETGSDEHADGILVLEDVTERLRLEKVRSDFVANASHELKTPISAIRGLAETIIDDPKMPAEVFSRFIERIRQQSIRLDMIVKDLLHLSRFDSAERRTDLMPIKLHRLLTQVFQANQDHARDAGVTLELDLQADNLEIRGDTEAINQLVTNLVDNAIKYTGQGGSVKLRLARVGDLASIEVEDTGMGISKVETQRIFERFYRVDRARSKDIGGTGLGLAIVKHIANAHHGTVTVESQLGKGSTFMVRIPLAETETAVASTTSA